MYEKAKFACLYLMRPQKMKFESVQINMKHVLYLLFTLTISNHNNRHSVLKTN